MRYTNSGGTSENTRTAPRTIQWNVVFLRDIREMTQDETLGKMLTVRPLRVNGVRQRYQKYV